MFNGWNMRFWIVWHATATSVCISLEKTQWARVLHSKHFMRRWFRPLSLHIYIYILLLYIQYTYYIILSHYYTVIMKSACIYPKTFGHPLRNVPSQFGMGWSTFFMLGYSMSDISMWIKMLGRTMYMFDILCWVDVSQPRNYHRFTSKTVELLYTPPWHGDTIAQLSSRFISYVARSKPASRPLADLHTRLRE